MHLTEILTLLGGSSLISVVAIRVLDRKRIVAERIKMRAETEGIVQSTYSKLVDDLKKRIVELERQVDALTAEKKDYDKMKRALETRILKLERENKQLLQNEKKLVQEIAELKLKLANPQSI